jgi:glycosyltransferase involved in cell wall biosynthesis
LLPLFPYAVESLDVGSRDIVISSSHAVAKGVRTSASQFHVCYCHTPMRYAWDLREQYLAFSGMASGVRGAIIHRILDHLRDWDRRASDRVTHFVANSQFVRERIARCYGRDAAVIHPPVDTDFFRLPATPTRGDFYVTASRWVPYKRIELIVEAFREMPQRRLIVIGDGPQARMVRAAAGPNVEFVGEVARERLRDLLQRARAFVFAAEEDFGILPVEAQACGTAVVAFGRGGARETVRGLDDAAPTGVFFDEQRVDAIVDAVERFEATCERITSDACRVNAERFSAERFRREFAEFVSTRFDAWRRGG